MNLYSITSSLYIYSHKPLLPGIQRLKRTLCVRWLENHDVIKSRQGSRSFLFAHLIYFSSSSKSYLSRRNDNLQLATALVKKRFHLIQWFSNTLLSFSVSQEQNIVIFYFCIFQILSPCWVNAKHARVKIYAFLVTWGKQ